MLAGNCNNQMPCDRDEGSNTCFRMCVTISTISSSSHEVTNFTATTKFPQLVLSKYVGQSISDKEQQLSFTAGFLERLKISEYNLMKQLMLCYHFIRSSTCDVLHLGNGIIKYDS